MNTDFIIRNETESDFHATEDLVRNSFWNVYKPGCSEHFVLHELRNSKNFVPELDFVMEKDSKLIGQIVFVKAKIFCDDGTELSVMTFGPLGIAQAEAYCCNARVSRLQVGIATSIVFWTMVERLASYRCILGIYKG